MPQIMESITHSKELQSTVDAPTSSNIEERDLQLKTVQNSLNIDDENAEGNVIAMNNCTEKNLHSKNEDLKNNAATTAEGDEIQICTNAENDLQHLDNKEAASIKDATALKRDAEKNSSYVENCESLSKFKNKENVNSNEDEDSDDKDSAEDGGNQTGEETGDETGEEGGEEREDVEHLKRLEDDEEENKSESDSISTPTQDRILSQTTEVDLLQSDEEEQEYEEEEQEGEEEENEKQEDTNLEADETSFQGIRIDVDDSEDCFQSDEEESREVEKFGESEEKEIFTISDEESAQCIRDVAVQNEEMQDDEASQTSEEDSDGVINVDDDEDDDETQDEINLNDSVPEEGSDQETECTAENENKCGDDDQVTAMEICSSSSSGDVLSKDQDVELLNGVAENSDEELKIDIDDNDEESHHSTQVVRKVEEDDVDASRNHVHPTKEEPNHKNAKTAGQSDLISSEGLADLVSNEDSLINTIRREFSKNEYHTEVPKLNGDHKISETDQSNAVIDAQPHFSHSYNSIALQNDEDGSCGKEVAKENTNKEEGATDHSSTQHTVSHSALTPTKQPDDGEDEVSRFSISSSASSSSTATSSSHQLVIDHPIEDGASTTLNSHTNLLPSLKVSLKRKLSSPGDTLTSSPPHKLTHLEPESSDTMIEEKEAEQFKSLNGECFPGDEEKSCLVDSVLPESSVFEKPREYSDNSTAAAVPERESIYELSSDVAKMPETTTTHAVSQKVPEDLFVSTTSVRNSPLLNSLLLNKRKKPITRAGDGASSDACRKTKYLCFNCKKGCYETLISLNEHQRHCLANNSLLPGIATKATHTTTPSISPEQLSGKLDKVAENSALKNDVSETVSEKKHYYKCSSCGTFHENWNIFLHISEIHNRHMCLYCLRMFPTAEKLSLHLEIKHDLEQNHYNSEEALRESVQGSLNETRFLMCCTCQHVFLEHENFSDHVCTEFMQACSMCGQKGRHTNQCKTQNEAKRSKVKKKSKAKDLEETQKSNVTFVAPQSEAVQMLPTVYCDKAPIAPSPPLHSTFQPSPAFQSAPSLHHHYNHPTEGNNSGCDMIVDESFNNSSNYVGSVSRSAPSALDERDFLQQLTSLSPPVQSPDQPQIPDPVAERPEVKQPLIVPKLKLRVPKEFQKSVDAALTTSESEDDDDSALNEDDVDRLSTPFTRSTLTTPNLEVDNESATDSIMALQNTSEALTKQQPSMEEEDSQDEPNSSLVRILQEIERTKMDIKRTKETLNGKPLPTTPRMPTISQSSTRTGDHSWSPTPPASPNSQWFTPRRMISQSEGETDAETIKEMLSRTAPPLPPPFRPQRPPLPFLPPPSPIQKERRNTTGSDMDIDETISGHTVQSIERSTQRGGDSAENDDADKSTAETAVAKENYSINSRESSSNTDVKISNAALEAVEKIEPPPLDEEEPMKTEEDVSEKDQLMQPGSVAATEQPFSMSLPDMDASSVQVKSPTDKKQGTETMKPLQPTPSDGIPVADEDINAVDLQLNRPLEKFEMVEFVRICLNAVYPLCLYCNHARRIAVNGKSLVLHMIAQHRFAATVDSITAEELKPNTIVAKLKSFLQALEKEFFNLNNYCTYGDGAFTYDFNERIYECFQCRFVTTTHKELYLHNRKMHLRSAILCFMCRSNFYSFSEILCHICPGEPNRISVFDLKFRCCLCEVDNIPSPFRLMVHLRKKHFACDVCLDDCGDQGRLSSHVWKHKLHHVCYRCGIAYRNKIDITKHLFWKHGTESILCKHCAVKRWRHIYHFCVPPTTFVCDICHLSFSKATYLKVHRRIHSGDLRYPCSDENCGKKFISRRMLLKHAVEHEVPPMIGTVTPNYEGNEEKTAEKLPEPSAELKTEGSKPIKEEVTADVKPSLIDGVEKKTTETKSELSTEKVNPETEKSKHKDGKASHQKGSTCSRQHKKKRSRRSKMSFEDLNLIAPNLSESDSSEETSPENKSKSEDDSLLVPKVMLSPPSETEHNKEEDQSCAKDKSSAATTDSTVLDIWKNLLQAQGSDAAIKAVEPSKDATDYSEDNYPTPRMLHVTQSDHDYCVMFKPDLPKVVPARAVATHVSPQKRKTAKSPRRNASVRHSDASSGSSSDGSSDSDSSSSCSCGPNCSCTTTDSASSSSSSNSNDSGESSASSHTSRKRQHKKSERDRMRKKSASVSPMKKHHHEESGKHMKMKKAALFDADTKNEPTPASQTPSPRREALFSESDLETAESETDEEFYDKHPQKMATEMLAQKRAQLMAQTRLSPSHNYDIVENSRPSTPSLPDEVARENRVKLKKKKRDRTAPALNATQEPLATQPVPPAAQHHVPMSTANVMPTYELLAPRASELSGSSLQLNTASQATDPQLTLRPTGPHNLGRISDGSSSDVDGSLKRSKRARRPNKFYGYTSDDELLPPGLGQPLIMGMRAIKPQPPPQLTWLKEDLPTPSKSLLNNQKIKTPRPPKIFSPNQTDPTMKMNKKRTTLGDKTSNHKRNSEQQGTFGLPPIPTLKIRPSQIGLGNGFMSGSSSGRLATNRIPSSQVYSPGKESDDEEVEPDSTDSSSGDEQTQQLLNAAIATTSGAARVWNSSLQQIAGSVPKAPQPNHSAFLLPSAPPPPPQATVFNHKIPPALLPNPDFATLQYFKANNIRYPIRPPSGARHAREGESVYCYCRCPYDEVSEMIACDGENCLIEWFHFECVGIMVAPQGKWFCAECRPQYSEELYPVSKA